MDYLRKCYVTRVRPFAGSNDTAEVRWYWAPEGAPVLRGAIWRSSFWYVSDLDGQYPPPPAIGEERSVPFKWSPGQLGQRLAVAKCVVGDRSWFAAGIPPEANVPNPPPLPACCRLPVRIALGGFQLGGRVEAVPIVQGGLLAGGEAFRTLIGASGGLMLGGVTAPFGTFVVGGLLVGGEAFPEPLDAEGGLLVGGEAFPEPLDAEGGLLIGGVQETELAPYGLGGLWIGGEAQEPMALLYCSLRITNTVNFPPSTRVTMPWNTVEEDPSGMYSSGTPTRITVPANGVYAVQHQFLWPLVSSAYNITGELLVNGTLKQILYSGGVSASYSASFGGTALLHLAAGDYLEIDGIQSSGLTVNPPTIGEDAPCFRVAGLAADQVPILSGNVYKNGGQTITTGTRTAIIFDTVNTDPHSMWSVAHPSRMTAPSAGTYLVQWAFGMGTGAGSGKWSSLIAKNGSAIFDVTGFPLNMNSTGLGAGSYTLPLAASDYVEVMVFHNLGSNLTLQSYDSVTAWVTLTRLGPTG